MQVRQGRVNFTTLAELPEGAPVMSGIFSIHNKPAVILFDSGATHSFISAKFGARLGLDFCHTKRSCMIATPGGKIASNQITTHVPLKLGSKVIKTDLFLLNLEGMDWMTKHKVLLDLFPSYRDRFTTSRSHHTLFATTRVLQFLCLCHKRP